MDVYQRRRLVALSAIAGVFILFVLLIRSCGGDDESTEPLATGASGASGVAGVPTSLSPPDYVASADPICLDANTQLDNVDESDPVQSDTDKSQIVAGELQQLQTLPPPTDGTDQLDQFLSELQKQSLAYQDRSTASERGDDAQVAQLGTTLETSQDKAATAASKFGFKVCGDLGKVGESTGGGGSGGGTETTDTGGTVTPTEPVTPTTTTPVPVAPPETEGGTVTPTPTAPPTDGGTGTDGGSSGGVSP